MIQVFFVSAWRLRLALLLTLFTLTLASVLKAQGSANKSAAHDPLLARFESRYHASKTLSATFLEQYSENGHTTRKEAGTAYFLRPGRMRWDYESPEKNVFLVDGKFAWFYTPADRTVSRTPAKTADDWRTPLALLTGEMKVSRVCSSIQLAADVEPSVPDNKVYRCLIRDAEGQRGTPNGASSQEALFDITPEGELARISVREQAGIRIDFSFGNWHWDPPLEKSLFQFTPPVGVAIVDGVLPDSSNVRQ